MILNFNTNINGKPTYFVERIHAGLIVNELMDGEDENCLTHEEYDIDAFAEKHIKIHTIRVDKAKRWKPGTKIDFFINARQKNMFRFAPVLPVVRTQQIEIYYELHQDYDIIRPIIWIDDMIFFDELCKKDKGMLQLANNDGFDTIEDFFNYFNTDFKGKIIHWTTKKY